MFAYRVGFPLWKIMAALGAPMKVLICVHRDEEAGVYFAHSPDLRGLVVEAKTLDDLAKEVESGIQTLMEELLPASSPRPHPTTDLRLDGATCAA